MNTKKTGLAAILLAGIMLLGGCEKITEMTGSSWTPQETAAISISKDGTITEIIQETLDQTYYNGAELESQINSEVDKYNAEKGENTIQVKEYTAENGKVSLKLKYASAEDYAAFNNTEFYYGSMINAQLEGYLFDVPYKKVRNGVVQGTNISGSEVIKSMDKQVLILLAPMEVKLPGAVLYTSANADITAADVVIATGQQEDQTQELLLPSNEVYQIGEEPSFDEAMAANRVYIVFEEE